MIKRAIDLLIIFIFFPVLLPVFVCVVVLVYFKLSAPVFFRQKRVGVNSKIFEMYKFRSMTLERDSHGNLLPDHQRLTWFGRFLRSTSLDELPGLINVIKGEMSLVGPRPLLVDYLPFYSIEQKQRHAVSPGITGWAQVNGRNSLSWEDKFKLDVWYVENHSIFLDFKILFLTIKKVIIRDGISPTDAEIMPRFDDHVMKLARKIAVISDIHGNADALDQAIKIIEGRELDLIVVLGDLLTYGCQPNKVLERMTYLNANYRCLFIKGNHDEFYFKSKQNDKTENYKMPSFVKESIDWTARNTQGLDIGSLFRWSESFVINSIFFAHANPFTYGDWTYVEKIDQCLNAADVLRKMKLRAGVFGHTHRPLLVECSPDRGLSAVEDLRLNLRSDNIFIINPGAIGQPRGHGYSFMILEVEDDAICVEKIQLNLDISNSIQLIVESSLSEETKIKLESYLRS